MPDAPQFSRRSIVAACNLLAGLYNHTRFEQVLLEIGAEHMLIEGSVQAKANMIARLLIADPNERNWEGNFLVDAIVLKAASLPSSHMNEDFVWALARDGFTLSERGEVRRMMPDVSDLPQADDEVHSLLDELGMGDAKGHLDQAIDNHARGQWAAANAQLRSFMEELFNWIAERLDPTAAALATSENKRNFLATRQPPFLYEELGEWGQNGKNFVNGVFKRLHGHGSHPGLSDEEDCTFRLHLVILLARMLLRRAKEFVVTV